ncbi:cupin domain-containing protein [Nitrosopumilus sp. b1]|uniref:cupin domain-containing protein n=1 Tax=Nitrosopumilus sp. b1 TaxID=2109907 RepID=UPI0015F3F0ED|nr:cupin domain-containing protein [Nitrosopumilus sp. b1]KAF6244019.1 cupin domain-containing protein [Nitrosopumilus sp. b1]
MSFKDLNEVETIHGNEGTIIRQLFHPHNTLDGIRYSIAHFTLNQGKKSSKHKLKSSEVYYFLKGNGIIHVDDTSLKVKTGSVIYVPPMSPQHVENTGSENLEFLCIVDPAWKQDDEIIIK